jgi:hypothetical protein
VLQAGHQQNWAHDTACDYCAREVRHVAAAERRLGRGRLPDRKPTAATPRPAAQ